jgi:hypothetical protein
MHACMQAYTHAVPQTRTSSSPTVTTTPRCHPGAPQPGMSAPSLGQYLSSEGKSGGGEAGERGMQPSGLPTAPVSRTFQLGWVAPGVSLQPCGKASPQMRCSAVRARAHIDVGLLDCVWRCCLESWGCGLSSEWLKGAARPPFIARVAQREAWRRDIKAGCRAGSGKVHAE